MLKSWLLNRGLVLASYAGHPVGKAVTLLRASQSWNAAALESHQGQALNRLMHHCYDHVPYYRDLMKGKALRADDFQHPSDLAKLPYLTRDIIRDQGERLRADNIRDSACQFRRSGGTTGEPIRVAIDRRGRGFEVAAYLRGLQWMNYQFGRPLVSLFGGSLGLSSPTMKSKVRDWLFTTRFLPAFELTPQNLGSYVETIRAAKGGVLNGYASAVLNVAEYMAAAGLRGSPLAGVICTSEYMPEEWRMRIADVLGAPVFCYYGCGEVNSIAYECAGEEGYIVSQEHLIVEAAGGKPENFQTVGRGEVCLTTLFNYAMPLIRYLNGDLLEFAPRKAADGRQRIAKVEGRVMDQLLATDGHRVSSVLPTHMVFKSGLPVWKYQVVQTEHDAITFHYLTRTGETLSKEMQDTVVGVFRRYLGNDLEVRFLQGGFEVPRSGKHRFVINKVAEAAAA